MGKIVKRKKKKGKRVKKVFKIEYTPIRKQRVLKVSYGQSKSGYCRVCRHNNKDSPYCEFMAFDEILGGTYCSNKSFYDNWYCRNSMKVEILGRIVKQNSTINTTTNKAAYPHSGTYNCKLTNKRCPYNKEFIYGIYHLNGYEKCENWLNGLNDVYKRIYCIPHNENSNKKIKKFFGNENIQIGKKVKRVRKVSR